MPLDDDVDMTEQSPSVNARQPYRRPTTRTQTLNVATPPSSAKVYIIAAGAVAVLAIIAGGVVVALKLNKSQPAAEAGGAAVIAPETDGDELEPSHAAQFKPEEIAERLIPSTVLITTDEEIHSLGSGVLVHRDPHVVLTNWHVVADAKDKTAIVFFPDRDARNQVISRIEHYRNKSAVLGIPAKILLRDTERDIAMLELARVPETAVPIPLASESAKQLEHVYGNGQSGVKFSALWQSNEGSCRQLVDFPLVEGSPGTSRVLITSQPVNPGDSGGPVVNSRLELVGIVRAKASKYIKVLEKGAAKGLSVEGLDNFSLGVDIEELRSFLNDGFRLAYRRGFPTLPNPFTRGFRTADGRPIRPRRRSPEQLVKVLETGTPEQVPPAISEIREHGIVVVPLLINMLNNEEQRGNWPRALEALERIDNPASAAPAVEVAIRCLKDDLTKTKIETRIAAAKFLRAVNPYGKKEAQPVLWKNLGVNDVRLRNEVRATIRGYGPYSVNDINNLKALAGLTEVSDPEKLRAVNPFVKAFYIILLEEMAELSQIEFSQQIELLKVFNDPDPRLRGFMLRELQESPFKFSRRDRFRCCIPMLGDTGEDVSRDARIVLDKMTYLSREEIETCRLAILKQDGNPIQDERGNPIQITKRGYCQAEEWELFNTEDYVYPISDKKNGVAKICHMRKVVNEDVVTLMELLADPNTPAEGHIYALDLILNMGARAQVDITGIARLLSERLPTDPKRERSLSVIVRALAVILSQKKPIQINVELLRLCDLKQEQIRSLAIYCLASIDSKAANKVEGPPNPKDDPSNNWKATDRAILTALFTALEDDNPKIREAARKSLNWCLERREGRFEDELDMTVKALNNPVQSDKRMMAARVLSSLGDKAAVAAPELVKALDDKEIMVRINTVQALGKMGAAAKPGVVKIGELLLHEFDADLAKLQDGVKRESPEYEAIGKREWLRQEALKALSQLKEHAQEALPALSKFIAKTTIQEYLVQATGAIKSIVQNPAVKCDKELVDSLLNLFQHELIKEKQPNGQVVEKIVESIERLLELNSQKRSPISNAALDVFRAMGPRGLPVLREYLFTKKERVNPGAEGLQVIGAVVAVVVIASRDDFKIDREVQDRLLSTLDAMSKKHKAWLSGLRANPRTSKKEIEVMDRMVGLINDALRLLGKAMVIKN